jgi:hypothetical protein
MLMDPLGTAGYTSIVNCDWSAVVIELMQEEYADIPELKCEFPRRSL